MTLAAPFLVASVQVSVAPARADWTYPLGATVRYTVVVRDAGVPCPGVRLTYTVGADGYAGAPHSAVTDRDGRTEFAVAGLDVSRFQRCTVTVPGDRAPVQATTAAAFTPEAIVATQRDPADFAALWAAQRAELEKIPARPERRRLPATGAAGTEGAASCPRARPRPVASFPRTGARLDSPDRRL